MTTPTELLELSEQHVEHVSALWLRVKQLRMAQDPIGLLETSERLHHDLQRAFLLTKALRRGGRLNALHARSHKERMALEHEWEEFAQDSFRDLHDRIDIDAAWHAAHRGWQAPEDPTNGILVGAASLAKRLRTATEDGWFRVTKRYYKPKPEDIQEVEKWGGERGQIAKEALQSGNGVVFRDLTGKITAVAEIHKEALHEGVAEGGRVVVEKLVAAPGLEGKPGLDALQEIAKDAVKSKSSLGIKPKSTAQTDYFERLGFARMAPFATPAAAAGAPAAPEAGAEAMNLAAQLVAQFAMQGGVFPASSAEVSRALASAVNEDAWRTGAFSRYLGLAAKTAEQAGQVTLEQLGLNKTFAFAHPSNMAQDMFSIRGSKVIQNMYGEHMNRLTKIIMDATSPKSAKGIAEVTKEIRIEWPKLSKYQAERIARTETGAVWMHTAANAYEANGIGEWESIVATGPSIDIDTNGACDFCVEMGSYVHEMSEELPPYHPNCRCDIIPALEDPDTGEPWLPPDEPWTGGGDGAMPEFTPKPAPEPGAPTADLKWGNNILATAEEKNALKQGVDEWPDITPSGGSAAPFKQQANELLETVYAIRSMLDANGRLLAVGGYEEGFVLPSMGRTMFVHQIESYNGSRYAMLRRFAMDTTENKGDWLAIDTANIPPAMFTKLHGMGFEPVPGRPTVLRLKSDKLPEAFRYDAEPVTAPVHVDPPPALKPVEAPPKAPEPTLPTPPGPHEPLEGLPAKGHVDTRLRDLAQKYMDEAGLPYKRPTIYTEVNPDRAERIAAEYDKMLDILSNDVSAEYRQAVLESYEALKAETLAQYKVLVDNGYKFEFNPKGKDPYDGSPWAAERDIQDNQHAFVFPTEEGYGAATNPTEVAAMAAKGDNPMLSGSGIIWKQTLEDGTVIEREAYVNDIFRGVHDTLGHSKEGVGFRASGEDNAWRSHQAMYSEKARGAMTSETRGQNSWVNYGPHAKANRTAGQMETVYAEQKLGLMPEWTWREGAGDDMLAVTAEGEIQPVTIRLGQQLNETDVGTALELAKARGGVVVNGYEGQFTDIAQAHDFKIVGRMRFDKDLAPEGWKVESYGQPDMVFMALKSKNHVGDVAQVLFRDKDVANAWSYALAKGSTIDEARASAFAEKALRELELNDGYSLDAIGSIPERIQRYRVSLHESEQVFDKMPTHAEIAEFYRANVAKLAGKGKLKGKLYFGGWRDAETGKVYLDISTSYRSLQPAKTFGELNHQIAIYDAKAGEIIHLDPPVKIGPAPQPELDAHTLDVIQAKGLNKWPPDKGAKSQEILGDLDDTVALYSKNGVWTEERAAVHEDIMAQHFAGKKLAGDSPTIYLTSGGGASGKSGSIFRVGDKDLTLDELKLRDDVIVVDPDAIKAMLPEFEEIAKTGDVYAANAVHEESSMLAKQITRMAEERGYNIVLDTTGSGHGFVDKLLHFKQAGYHVKVSMSSIPTTEAIVRAVARGEKTGRYVCVDALERAHSEASRALLEWFGPSNEFVDEWRVYDNLAGRVLVAEKRLGQVTVYDEAKFEAIKAKAGAAKVRIPQSTGPITPPAPAVKMVQRLELKPEGTPTDTGNALTKTQVQSRAQKVADGLTKFYDSPKITVRFEPESTAAWDTEARTLIPPGKTEEEVWYGQGIMDKAKAADMGVMPFRQIAHEAAHTVSGVPEGPLPGISQTIEEGSAEIMSISWWAKEAQPFDVRDAVKVAGEWTKPGIDSLANSVVYRDEVTEVIRRAASKVGWDRQKVMDEVVRVMKGDHYARLNFRDTTTLADIPKDVGGEDAPALIKWLIQEDHPTTGVERDITNVQEGLHSWVGAPDSMKIHMDAYFRPGDWTPYDDLAGSGKAMRDQAKALLEEVHYHGKVNDVTLYRGSSGDVGDVRIPRSYTPSKKVAAKFGTVETYKPGTLYGIRAEDFDVYGPVPEERQWIAVRVENRMGVEAKGEPQEGIFEPVPEGKTVELEYPDMSPLDGLTTEWVQKGPRRYLYFKEEGREYPVGSIEVREGEDGIKLSFIGVDKEYQGRGMAASMTARLRELLGSDKPIIHGDFVTPEGAGFGTYMTTRFPEWNRLMLKQTKDGEKTWWDPGNPLKVNKTNNTFGMGEDKFKETQKIVNAALKKGEMEKSENVVQVFDAGGIGTGKNGGGLPAIREAEKAITSVFKVEDTVKFTRLDAADSASGRLELDGSIAVHELSGFEGQVSTITHEFGHYVDSRVLGTPDAWFLSTDSVNPDSLYYILKNSKTITDIRDNKFVLVNEENYMDRNYYLKSEEMFARAYEQYIALKSGNEVLLTGLRKMQADDLLRFQVWQDDEFIPIMQKFDEIFGERGLLVAEPKPPIKVKLPEEEAPLTPDGYLNPSPEEAANATKVYTAESNMRDKIGPGVEYDSINQASDFADGVWARNRDLWKGDVARPEFIEVREGLADAPNRSGLTYIAEGSIAKPTIDLGKNMQDQLTVLHEIAHAMFGPTKQAEIGHSEEFQQMFIQLLRREMPTQYGSGLQTRLALDVEYIPKPGFTPTAPPTKNWSWADGEVRMSQTPQYAPGWEEWHTTLKGSERSALEGWTKSSHVQSVNYPLLEGAKPTAAQAKEIEALDRAIAKAPQYSEPVTVWRGVEMGEGMDNAQLEAYLAAKYKPGSILEPQGFQATSFSPEPALDAALNKTHIGVVFEIKTTRGAFIKDLSSFKNEDELLLSRGERWQVKRVTRETFERFEDETQVERYVIQVEADTPNAVHPFVNVEPALGESQVVGSLGKAAPQFDVEALTRLEEEVQTWPNTYARDSIEGTVNSVQESTLGDVNGVLTITDHGGTIHGYVGFKVFGGSSSFMVDTVATKNIINTEQFLQGVQATLKHAEQLFPAGSDVGILTGGFVDKPEYIDALLQRGFKFVDAGETELEIRSADYAKAFDNFASVHEPTPLPVDFGPLISQPYDAHVIQTFNQAADETIIQEGRVEWLKHEVDTWPVTGAQKEAEQFIKDYENGNMVDPFIEMRYADGKQLGGLVRVQDDYNEGLIVTQIDMAAGKDPEGIRNAIAAASQLAHDHLIVRADSFWLDGQEYNEMTSWLVQRGFVMGKGEGGATVYTADKAVLRNTMRLDELKQPEFGTPAPEVPKNIISPDVIGKLHVETNEWPDYDQALKQKLADTANDHSRGIFTVRDDDGALEQLTVWREGIDSSKQKFIESDIFTSTGEPYVDTLPSLVDLALERDAYRITVHTNYGALDAGDVAELGFQKLTNSIYYLDRADFEMARERALALGGEPLKIKAPEPLPASEMQSTLLHQPALNYGEPMSADAAYPDEAAKIIEEAIHWEYGKMVNIAMTQSNVFVIAIRDAAGELRAIVHGSPGISLTSDLFRTNIILKYPDDAITSFSAIQAAAKVALEHQKKLIIDTVYDAKSAFGPTVPDVSVALPQSVTDTLKTMGAKTSDYDETQVYFEHADLNKVFGNETIVGKPAVPIADAPAPTGKYWVVSYQDTSGAWKAIPTQFQTELDAKNYAATISTAESPKKPSITLHEWKANEYKSTYTAYSHPTIAHHTSAMELKVLKDEINKTNWTDLANLAEARNIIATIETKPQSMLMVVRDEHSNIMGIARYEHRDSLGTMADEVRIEQFVTAGNPDADRALFEAVQWHFVQSSREVFVINKTGWKGSQAVLTDLEKEAFLTDPSIGNLAAASKEDVLEVLGEGAKPGTPFGSLLSAEQGEGQVADGMVGVQTDGFLAQGETITTLQKEIADEWPKGSFMAGGATQTLNDAMNFPDYTVIASKTAGKTDGIVGIQVFGDQLSAEVYVKDFNDELTTIRLLEVAARQAFDMNKSMTVRVLDANFDPMIPVGLTGSITKDGAKYGVELIKDPSGYEYIKIPQGASTAVFDTSEVNVIWAKDISPISTSEPITEIAALVDQKMTATVERKLRFLITTWDDAEQRALAMDSVELASTQEGVGILQVRDPALVGSATEGELTGIAAYGYGYGGAIRVLNIGTRYGKEIAPEEASAAMKAEMKTILGLMKLAEAKDTDIWFEKEALEAMRPEVLKNLKNLGLETFADGTATFPAKLIREMAGDSTLKPVPTPGLSPDLRAAEIARTGEYVPLPGEPLHLTARVDTGELRGVNPGSTAKDPGTGKMNKDITSGLSERGVSGLKIDVMERLDTRLRDNPEWKPNIVKDLYGYSSNGYSGDVSKDTVAQLVNNWAISSSDADWRGVAIQLAAKEELGIEMRAYAATYFNDIARNNEIVAEAQRMLDRNPALRSSLRSFIRAQYEETQAYLKEQGIDEVTIYRGLKINDVSTVPWDVGFHVTEMADNPLSSWSIRYQKAYGTFAGGTLLRASVPREMIFSMPRTGFGCSDEYEVLVINTGRNKVWVAQRGDIKLTEERLVSMTAERDVAEQKAQEITVKYQKLQDMNGGSGPSYGDAERTEMYELRDQLWKARSKVSELNNALELGSIRFNWESEAEFKEFIDQALLSDHTLAGKVVKPKGYTAAQWKQAQALRQEIEDAGTEIGEHTITLNMTGEGSPQQATILSKIKTAEEKKSHAQAKLDAMEAKMEAKQQAMAEAQAAIPPEVKELKKEITSLKRKATNRRKQVETYIQKKIKYGVYINTPEGDAFQGSLDLKAALDKEGLEHTYEGMLTLFAPKGVKNIGEVGDPNKYGTWAPEGYVLKEAGKGYQTRPYWLGTLKYKYLEAEQLDAKVVTKTEELAKLTGAEVKKARYNAAMKSLRRRVGLE